MLRMIVTYDAGGALDEAILRDQTKRGEKADHGAYRNGTKGQSKAERQPFEQKVEAAPDGSKIQRIAHEALTVPEPARARLRR